MVFVWLKSLFTINQEKTPAHAKEPCKFSAAQLEQIHMARETGLSDRQIDTLLTPDLDPWDMQALVDEVFYIPDIPHLINHYKPSLSKASKARYYGSVALFGGICGDIAGSRYEFSNCSRKNLHFDSAITSKSRITDDSILMLATLEAVNNPETDQELRILLNKHDGEFTDESLPFGDTAYARSYRKIFHSYPAAGYGGGFYQWGFAGTKPYRSFGNGSAMRIAPVGEAFDDVEDVILHAIASAACTHNHPEGIKGAVVVAVCIWMGRHGYSKDDIFSYVKAHYENQDMIRSYTMNEVRLCRQGRYAVACQFAVPAAVTCFLQSTNYEECVENALSFDGDSDTIAAIAGAIRAAYDGGVSPKIIDICAEKIPDSLNLLFSEIFTKKCRSVTNELS